MESQKDGRWKIIICRPWGVHEQDFSENVQMTVTKKGVGQRPEEIKPAMHMDITCADANKVFERATLF